MDPSTMNSNAIFLPLAAALTGNVIYHLASRSASSGASAFATMAIVYLIGAVLAGVIALSLERAGANSFAEAARHPAIYALAIAVLMIEAGFLLAYRAGAAVSSSSLLVNSSVAVVLALIGIVALKEGFNWRLGFGMALTLAGVIIISTSRASSS
jgi:drug/metabolite transporter (DMT)-like permease